MFNGKMRAFISVFVTISILAGNFQGVSAATQKIFVSLNGEKISSTKVGRKLKKGYLVNAKLLSKKMKAKYSFSKKKKQATIKKGSKKVVLTLGKKIYKIKKKSYKAPVAPKKYGSAVYISPTALAKAFSYKYLSYSIESETLEIWKKAPSDIGNEESPVETDKVEEKTQEPNAEKTTEPTQKPTVKPTQAPTAKPTQTTTPKPTQAPTVKPTQAPTVKPTKTPSVENTPDPTASPFPNTALITKPAAVTNSLTRVVINTQNKKELTNDKDEEINALIYIDDGKQNPKVIVPQCNIVLTGRGNSTFYEHPTNLPKKPMKFEFVKGEGKEICSMPKAREWNLLANLYDRSLIRNCIGLNLAKILNNLEWTPSYELVEVYLNGDYEGVYLLTENVEIQENRLNLDDSGDDLGFLVEWDLRAREESQAKYDALKDKTGASVYDYYFKVPGILPETPADINKRDEDHRYAEGVTFTYKDPKGNKLTQKQRDYIKNTCIKASDSIMKINGAPDYKTLWDIDSMVDYYIVQNYACNSDAMTFSSIFMYKHKGANQKMKMGPMWDYDIYFGNGMTKTSNLNGDAWKIEFGNPWVQNLVGWNGGYASGTYKTAAHNRWNAMKSAIKKATIDYAEELEVKIKDAADRNFRKWPCLSVKMMGDGERKSLPGTFAGEMAHLKKWLNARYEGLDDYYNSWVYIY